MSLILEQKIETAWITLLSANSYIVDNSIPVQSFRDGAMAITGKMVLVHVNPVKNDFPSSTLWTANVEIMAATYIEEDVDQTILNELYQECLYLARSASNLALTDAGAVKFNGRTMLESGSQMFDEEGIFQNYTINIECHVQE